MPRPPPLSLGFPSFNPPPPPPANPPHPAATHPSHSPAAGAQGPRRRRRVIHGEPLASPVITLGCSSLPVYVYGPNPCARACRFLRRRRRRSSPTRWGRSRCRSWCSTSPSERVGIASLAPPRFVPLLARQIFAKNSSFFLILLAVR